MTKNVQELAEILAAAELHVQMIRESNRPVDTQERIKADARYRLAHAAMASAELDYREAVNKLSTEQLIAISR